jgi:hypothetical protein
MKKTLIAVAVSLFLLSACNQQGSKTAPMTSQDSLQVKIEEQSKQVREDWNNWDNLTDERKKELLDMQKKSYDQAKAMKEAREARKAKFEAAMDNWDNLTIEEKKAAFDLMIPQTPQQEGATTQQSSN